MNNENYEINIYQILEKIKQNDMYFK